jgi:radical SAM superfamily enzyme YgiQ (UPF0313 family)
LKLLLIEPANRLAIKKNKLHFFENIARGDYFRVPPLALGVLAGLTPPEWEIKILQEPVDRIDFDEEVDIVGITAATHTVKRGYEIADEFRKRGKMIIMGGIHPSVLYNEALQHCDAVCIGEAEAIWKNILNDAKQGKLRKTYRSKEPFDLKYYTSPRRDLFPKRPSLFYSLGTIEASRGCPYNCDFCSVSNVHGKKIRYRPIDNIIPEMESIHSKRIFFVDNNIIANFKHSKELFREMIPLKKRWTAQATISIVKDQELLKLTSDSGCFGLLVGIESVTPEGFQKYNKSMKNLEELKEALKILKEYRIGVLAHMIFGNDFDTPESIWKSIENLMELDITSATLGIMVPYPGTKLASDLEKQNRILTRDWDHYDIHHLLFRPLNFTIKEFLEEMQNIRKEFFRIKAILSRTFNYRSPIAFVFNISSRAHNRVNYMLESVESED